jgi:hypothetical protein
VTAGREPRTSDGSDSAELRPHTTSWLTRRVRTVLTVGVKAVVTVLSVAVVSATGLA